MRRVFGHSAFVVVCASGLVGLLALVALRSPLSPRQSTAPAPTTAPSAAPPTRPVLAEALDLVPAESLLCWYARPFPDTAALSEQPSAIQTLLNLGLRVGGSALDAKAKLWAHALEAFGLAIRFPHALVLIDAQARPLESNPAAKRADKIRFAFIVESRGQDEPFARIIQAAINEQTDQGNARLTPHQAGPWSYMELRDRRLPPWCTIAWGQIEQYFVFAVGPDVWPAVAAAANGEAPALSQAEWLCKARQRRGRDALIEITLAARDIRERLDPFVDGRASAFFSAWHAEGVERAHWALGFEGRAMYCVAHVVEGGRLRERVFADPDFRRPHLLATIPDGARYAIYRVAPAEALPSFFNGLLATQSAGVRRTVLDLWHKIQAERGFDAERDILAHLGEHLVMHNYPPHPLHVPLAMTTLVEIRQEAAQVKRTVAIMSAAWRDAQREHVERTGEPNAMMVEEDTDGIWYLKFGPMGGPAWTVTDRFIITSWSPAALRSYLDKVGDRVGTGGPVR